MNNIYQNQKCPTYPEFLELPIVLLAHGSIVERGKHEELLSNENVYASQWSIQTGELDS